MRVNRFDVEKVVGRYRSKKMFEALLQSQRKAEPPYNLHNVQKTYPSGITKIFTTKFYKLDDLLEWFKDTVHYYYITEVANAVKSKDKDNRD